MRSDFNVLLGKSELDPYHASYVISNSMWNKNQSLQAKTDTTRRKQEKLHVIRFGSNVGTISAPKTNTRVFFLKKSVFCSVRDTVAERVCRMEGNPARKELVSVHGE